MLIAVAANGRDAGALIPERFEESRNLLIVETEGDAIEAVYDARDAEGLFFAEQTLYHDCEAIVCGRLEKPGFEALASNSVTRYYGAGLPAVEAARAARDNLLPLTTDHVGGSGCGSHERDRCQEHLDAQDGGD